ncbi:MAG TPA: PilN domain-containing protein [Armatimonadota bacterium]|jgi:Tfp pilus assembly protein PilN
MININLIAERRARKMREMTILRVGSLCVVLLSILMVLIIMYAGYRNISASTDVKTVTKTLDDLQPQYDELLQVRNQISALAPVETLLNEVQKSEGAWMIILGDISAITPRGVVLQTVGSTSDAQGVSLHIAGRATDEQTVAAFLLALRQQTSWAKTPNLKSVTSEDGPQTKAVRFDLTVPVQGLLGGDL